MSKRSLKPAESLIIFVAFVILTYVYTIREVEDTAVDQSINKYFRKQLGGRYGQILDVCGDLCDLSKSIEPGPGVGTVRAKVDCPAIFESEEIDRPSLYPPKPWDQIPTEIQDEYTHGGLVKVSPWFIKEQGSISSSKEAAVITKTDMQNHINKFQAGEQTDFYKNGSQLINKAAEWAGVEGKTVLVIGTQHPWVEAVLFTKKPKLVMTLEYGSFRSEYPDHEFVTPKVFRERYTAGTLPLFDLIVTYSSVEHSGLGRYGDALNPWGDILTIARAWCVTSPSAKLMIGVPTGGKDLIQFNAHRVYGPVLYPFLVTNWKFQWSSAGSYFPGPSVDDWTHQPIYIFEKLD